MLKLFGHGVEGGGVLGDGRFDLVHGRGKAGRHVFEFLLTFHGDLKRSGPCSLAVDPAAKVDNGPPTPFRIDGGQGEADARADADMPCCTAYRGAFDQRGQHRRRAAVIIDDLEDLLSAPVEFLKALSVDFNKPREALKLRAAVGRHALSGSAALDECRDLHSSSATTTGPPAAAIWSRKWWRTVGSCEVRGSIS